MNYRKAIAASLEYGRILSRSCIVFLYFSLFLGTALVPFVIVVSIIEHQYSLLSTLILSLLGCPACIYLIVHNSKVLTKIKPWLNDAVELFAQAKTIGTYQSGIGLNSINAKKIQIRFTFNKNQIVKNSGNPKNKAVFQSYSGYEGVFRRYTDRTIKILYSKQYDQVLILKTKTN